MADPNASYDQYGYQDENFVEAPKAPKMFDPTYLLPRLLFRWHWIVIGLVLGLAYGFVNIKLATPEYRSKATVRVAENTGGGQGDVADIDLRSKEAVSNVRETFEVSKLYESIAGDLAIQNLPRLRPPQSKTFRSLFQEEELRDPTMDHSYERAELAKAIRSWTKISTRKNSRLIDITVTHPDPLVSQKIANKVVEHHAKLRTQNLRSGSSGKVQILQENLRILNQGITEDNKRLNAYAGAVAAEKDFTEAKRAVQELEVTLRAKHPSMLEAVERLRIRRQALKDELTLALNNPADEAEWELNYDRYADLNDEKSFQLFRTDVSARVTELTTGLSTQNGQRESLREQLAEQESQGNEVEAEVDKYEEAKLPPFPFSPNRRKILTKGTVYGLGLGFALAFLFQLFDNKIGSVADVEAAYQLPVLSAIKRLPSEQVMEAEMAALTNLPLSFAQVHPNLAVPGWASDPVYSEMFRVLRASVSLLGDSSERNVTIVTSSIPGEGKTFCASNLALAFAKQGTRTLLIDFDLRKPAVHKIFGQPRHGFQGIVNVLNGTAGLGDVIATFEGFTNLSVIFSGTKSPSPGELLEPAKLYSIIEAYAGNFDHVVIDSAPLLPVPDTRILAPLAHNFCLVVRADHTPRKATYSALELLAADGLQPSGVVLNDFTEKCMQGGKYGYGYGYGEYGEDHDEEEEEIIV